MADQERIEYSGRVALEQYPQACEGDRYQAYKTLIQDLANHLGKEDVAAIAFNQNLPDSMKQHSALEVLSQLERQGLFSHVKIQPLAELLKGIHRNDLVGKQVEDYRRHFGTLQGLIGWLQTSSTCPWRHR